MQAPKQQHRLGDPMNQNCDCLGTYALLSEGSDGFVKAKPCSCIEALKPIDPYKNAYDDGFDDLDEHQEDLDFDKFETQLKILSALKNIHQSFSDAKIPNLYIHSLKETFYSAEVSKCCEELISEAVTNKFHFFYGSTGTGKTQSAIYLLMSYLRAHPQKSAFYIPTHILLEKKRLTSAYSFDAKSLKDNAELSYRNAIQKVKDIDFLVLDELGQTKLTDMESKVVFDLLDHRYASNKVTILISNHCDNKRLSLDGKKLSNLVGSRISSRLKSAKQVHFSGPDYRVQAKPEMITEEEAENFNMGEVSPKLLTLDDNTDHIMNWLARTPAFETIDTKTRKELTAFKPNGEAYDLDRPSATFHTNVWLPGNTLQVTGPKCDSDDRILYAVLVKQLTKTHKDGINGLVLKISIKAILRLLEQRECGENVNRVKRQLNRLVRMSLTFNNSQGKSWMGPLLTEVLSQEDGRNCHLKITFSHFMIAFYKAHEYTILNKNTFWALSGDSSSLFIFLTSHKNGITPSHYEKIAKVLGISSQLQKKSVQRRINGALKKLIAVGFLDPSSTGIKKDFVHAKILS